MKSMYRLWRVPIFRTVIVSIIVVLLIMLGIYMFAERTFWFDFLSNTMATIIGLVVGIPVAIFLSEYQERESELERKSKILRLIEQELLVNQVQLSGWKKSGDMQKEALTLQAMLKTELWRAFSDGGELEWIKNPILLDSISEAYFSIKSIQTLSERYFELRMLSNATAIHWVELDLFSTLEKAIDYADEVFLEVFTAIRKEIH